MDDRDGAWRKGDDMDDMAYKDGRCDQQEKDDVNVLDDLDYMDDGDANETNLEKVKLQGTSYTKYLFKFKSL